VEHLFLGKTVVDDLEAKHGRDRESYDRKADPLVHISLSLLNIYEWPLAAVEPLTRSRVDLKLCFDTLA